MVGDSYSITVHIEVEDADVVTAIAVQAFRGRPIQAVIGIPSLNTEGPKTPPPNPPGKGPKGHAE